MNNPLIKSITEEHTRHGEAVGKAIDEFTEKCMKSEKGADNDDSNYDKAIDEFTKAMDGEQGDHLHKCMKAIDENYELQDQKPKKAIDEFKSDMKGEHLKHVKAFDKAIDEFKGEFSKDGDNDAKQKAIDEFTKSAGTELQRHKEAHMEMCKEEADRMGEGETDEEKAARELKEKSGRTISAATGEKIKAVMKAIEDHHAEHEKASNEIIASLKELMGSVQDDEGQETKPEEKSGAAPKPRSSTSGATELEVYLFTQRLMRQVKTASEGALRQINEKIKEAQRGR